MATIKNLQQQLELINHNPDADCDRELSGCYIGDLLSWVMAHGGRRSAGSRSSR